MVYPMAVSGLPFYHFFWVLHIGFYSNSIYIKAWPRINCLPDDYSSPDGAACHCRIAREITSRVDLKRLVKAASDGLWDPASGAATRGADEEYRCAALKSVDTCP